MVVPWKVSYDKHREHIKKKNKKQKKKTKKTQRYQFNISQRYIQAHIVKTMIFPVAMYGCESWTRGKFEHRRIDGFECWCWKNCLRIPSTSKRTNQSVLKKINLGYLLEALMLKLKLQYFGHLMRKADRFEKS